MVKTSENYGRRIGKSNQDEEKIDLQGSEQGALRKQETKMTSLQRTNNIKLYGFIVVVT